MVQAIYTPMVPVCGGILAVVTQTETFGSKTVFFKWILSIAAGTHSSAALSALIMWCSVSGGCSDDLCFAS